MILLGDFFLSRRAKSGPSSPRPEFSTRIPFRPAWSSSLATDSRFTQNAFRGGLLYVWNPYDSNVQPVYFGESARNDNISTFRLTLAEWMTTGFNLKLMHPPPPTTKRQSGNRMPAIASGVPATAPRYGSRAASAMCAARSSP